MNRTNTACAPHIHHTYAGSPTLHTHSWAPHPQAPQPRVPHRRVAGSYLKYWPAARFAIVALIAAAAAALPNMEQMVALTGSVAFASIGFILPGAFFLKLRPGSPAVHDVCVSYVLVLLGLVGGVWGVYSTFA